MTVEWDGVAGRGLLRSDLEGERDALADAGRRCDWPTMLAMVARSPALANAVRPGGPSGYAPMHHVAHGGAGSDVAMQLVSTGAWRTLRTASGEQPEDIARRCDHLHLLPVLTPTSVRWVPADVLAAIEERFHAVIRGRTRDLVDTGSLRLPQLAPMLEVVEARWWFPVPGMYGGFAYHLEEEGRDARLVAESWCRVVGGSGERHEITATDTRLVASGFV